MATFCQYTTSFYFIDDPNQLSSLLCQVGDGPDGKYAPGSKWPEMGHCGYQLLYKVGKGWVFSGYHSAENCQFYLNNITCRFGLSQVIITDNGLQFIGEQFEAFLIKYRIQHRCSSVSYP